jgi:hypothetical protein
MRPSVKKLLLFGSTAPYSGALLALDFVGSRTNGQPYYMLNGATYPRVNNIPGWTYTGGTAAGTGSYAAKADGSLQFFPSYTNLENYSEQFDNAAWSKQAATITANAVTAPNGTLTADKLEETATTNIHWAYQDPAATANTTYTFSAYLKSAERTKARMALINSDGTNVSETIVDLTAGSIVSVTGSASISAAGSGWWRVTLTGTLNGTATRARTYLQTALADNSFNYAGTAGSGIYIWGAQLELGSTAFTYIPTTTAAVTVATPRITDAGYWAEEARTNLLLRSQEFDNASWVKTSTTVSANAVIAPDGTTTADKLQEDGATSSHSIYQAATVTPATSYTHIYYLKAAERGYAAIYDGNVSKGKYFDLINGAVLGNLTGAPDSASIAYAGNGWWRCSITVTSVGTTSTPIVYMSTNGSSYTYAGTAGSGIYIWQADLQAGSFATSPVPTTSVAVTRAADVGYVPLTGPTDGTMFAEGSFATASTFPILLGQDSGSTAGLNQSPPGVAHWNGTATLGPAGTASASPAITRAALAYVGTASRSMSANGSAVSTAATSIGTFNRVALGIKGTLASGQAYNGPIRRVVIYPRAFGNSELQAITTAGAY